MADDDRKKPNSKSNVESTISPETERHQQPRPLTFSCFLQEREDVRGMYTPLNRPYVMKTDRMPISVRPRVKVAGQKNAAKPKKLKYYIRRAKRKGPTKQPATKSVGHKLVRKPTKKSQHAAETVQNKMKSANEDSKTKSRTQKISATDAYMAFFEEVETKRKQRENKRKIEKITAEKEIAAVRKDAERIRRQREEERNRKRVDFHPSLLKYVKKMAYPPDLPPSRTKRIELSDPSNRFITGTYDEFKRVLAPIQRRRRLQRKVAQFKAITAEQLAQIIKNQKLKEKKNEDLLKRKQELFYDMLSKLEHQCREQYLNVVLKKFANLIAKLATKMRVPQKLIEPYARMQRGIFCNILLAIGVQPTNHSSIYYTSQEALKYEICHKLAHAFMSLIIKALDSAVTKDPHDNELSEGDFEMENYIKDRLMCAAEKKIINERVQSKTSFRSKINFRKKFNFYLNSEY